MSEALVLGDDTRAFLSTVRSLGRQGIAVDVVPTNWASPALRSRYIRRAIDLPDLSFDADAWQSALICTIARGRYDFILPCTDNMVVALQSCREKLPEQVLAMVAPAVFGMLFDKVRTREIALLCKVPVAQGFDISGATDAREIVDFLGLPVVIKARSSVFGRTPGKRHAVAICRTNAQVEDALGRLDVPEDYFAEGFFSGRGLGVSILANQGRVLQAFQHERVNESLSGKGAFYRRSARIDNELFSHVERITAHVGLTGLAMFEFCRKESNGEYILLEINARPWGSLPLAIASGVDFPFYYYRLITEGIEVPLQCPKVPVYGRNVTGDANSFLEAVSAFSLEVSKSKVAGNLAHRVLGLWRLVFGVDILDVAAEDDPEPAKADWAEYRRNWRDRLESRLGFYAKYIRHKELQRFQREFTGKSVKSILIICRGNVCRSPYAEHRLRKILSDKGKKIEVRSAGTLPQSGRETPPEGLSIARARGIDLSSHRSVYVKQLELHRFDVVLHFDSIIESEFRRTAGFDTPPLFNLAYFLLRPRVVSGVCDPDGQPELRFKEVYCQIDDALNEMTKRLT